MWCITWQSNPVTTPTFLTASECSTAQIIMHWRHKAVLKWTCTHTVDAAQDSWRDLWAWTKPWTWLRGKAAFTKTGSIMTARTQGATGKDRPVLKSRATGTIWWWCSLPHPLYYFNHLLAKYWQIFHICLCFNNIGKIFLDIEQYTVFCSKIRITTSVFPFLQGCIISSLKNYLWWTTTQITRMQLEMFFVFFLSSNFLPVHDLLNC